MVGGAQPIHGWWPPVAQCYIVEVVAMAPSTRFSAPPHTPPKILMTEGALEQREATPSPPQMSCFITYTHFHRPHLRCFPTVVLTELALSLPPLRQAEGAPATSTDEMANALAGPSSFVDGLCSPTPSVSVVASLCVAVVL
jgi:hypothetical protein